MSLFERQHLQKKRGRKDQNTNAVIWPRDDCDLGNVVARELMRIPPVSTDLKGGDKRFVEQCLADIMQ